MFKANSDIVRSTYIWQILKDKIAEKNLTISKIAENMWSTQPALSRSLNGKVVTSDNLFSRIAKAIWLSYIEIERIFKQADQEEYKYKYWEGINNLNLLEDMKLEDLKIMLAKEYWTTDEEVLNDIMEYAKFKISQWDTEFLKKLTKK